MSTFGQAACKEEERAIAAGYTAHIGKPFDTKVLLQEVEK